MRVELLVLLLGLSAVAGCTDPEPKPVAPATAGPAYETALEAEFNATLGRPTVEENEWTLLSLTTDADGEVAGFRWIVPPYLETGDFWLTLNAIPLWPADTDVTEWSLHFIGGNEDLTQVLGNHLSPTWHFRQRLAVPPEETIIPPQQDPFNLRVFAGELRPGTVVDLVLAAATAEPAEFGLALKVVGQDRTYPVAPRAQLDVGGADGLVKVPQRLGTADAFQIALYVDLGWLPALAFEAWTSAIDVEDRPAIDSRPTVAARDVTIRTSFDRPQGWTDSFGVLFGDPGAGRWNTEVRAREVRLEGRSVFAHASFATIPSVLLFGFPFWAAEGQGSGEDMLEFSATYVIPAPIYLLIVDHISFSAPLETVIQRWGPPSGGIGLGLLGDVPPAQWHTDSSNLHIVDPSGAHTVLLGFAAPGDEPTNGAQLASKL